ncbi:MAG TPA: helix-turn-helix transcriptional regulator [Glaciibacter sp.]|nr:helix-turn-helix transcriptional regulator [Glaciibacter sp.]
MKNHLKALRTERGWTQGALADQLGVSRQTVNALETGRYDPALPLAFRIARVFERPLESIFIPPEDDTDSSALTGDPISR